MKHQLTQSVEAILFATSEPQSFASLAKRLDCDKEAVAAAVQELAAMLDGHGITLIIHDETVTLATRADQTALIESIRKEELQKELSKASAETLAIVAYHPGTTKAQVEFIRGVNASYSLRALMMRGLIEQRGAGRSVAYHPTLETLKHFGVASVEELPAYRETAEKIKGLLEKSQEAAS